MRLKKVSFFMFERFQVIFGRNMCDFLGIILYPRECDLAYRSTKWIVYYGTTNNTGSINIMCIRTSIWICRNFQINYRVSYTYTQENGSLQLNALGIWFQLTKPAKKTNIRVFFLSSEFRYILEIMHSVIF